MTRAEIPKLMVRWTLLLGLMGSFSTPCPLWGAGDPARGYRWLTQKAYLPPDFHQSTFDRLWTVWPEPLRATAEAATSEQRRELGFKRYGLTGRPEDPTLPLQYVVDKQGNWTMNCFACHGGSMLGTTIPGLPNARYALETLTADVRQLKLKSGRPLSRMDIGSMVMPLGKTNGTTNAVMFGVALMAYRDADLHYYADRVPPKMIHHDMDAPAWWHFKKKQHIYIDGFAEKGHRALMQFMLVQQNGPDAFRQWEADFRDVYAYLESLEPPRYPFPIDQPLASRGEAVFRRECASCHGTYGAEGSYPGSIVPIDEIGTDPVRIQALAPANRRAYHNSWFAHYGKHDTIEDPGGYVAPPLDGAWASAPYFHNGAAPTLWHVLHPSERPAVWRRSAQGYDQARVGLEVEEFARLPGSIRRTDQLREYFNTKRFGKSAAGHDFPDVLSEDEKRSVLEYLKTL